MEIEKIIEDLIVKNDINQLSEEEIFAKYGKSEESYRDFIKVFHRIFAQKYTYPVIIRKKYEMIEKLIAQCQGFGSEQERNLEKDVLYEIERDRHYNRDDIAEMETLFLESIGATKLKKIFIKQEDVIEDILNSMWTIAGEDSISKEDFESLIAMMKQVPNIGENPLKIESVLAAYQQQHPKMNLCYNIPFLFATNYVLKFYPSACDEEFLSTAKSVIGVSKSHPEFAPISGYDQKNYNKIADFTMSNIKRLEEKEQETKKGKTFFQKIKEILPKR